ncbi:MAG: DUF3316 domain-containing protein [Tannerella sp.]|nr:DUF3316 domain-containing protein [Tannerella sp.]
MKKLSCIIIIACCFLHSLNARIEAGDSSSITVREGIVPYNDWTEADDSSYVSADKEAVPFDGLTEADNSSLKLVNEGILIAIGSSNLRNTYFSGPATKYDGVGLHILNERMKKTSFADRISSRQTVHLELTLTRNAASTINVFGGFADYSYGLHYRIKPVRQLKILPGIAVRGMFGFMYNTQASNNTTTLHIDLDMVASLAVIYSFRISNYPLAVRYQTDIPFMGALFTPKYGQSYYEIFGLGNTSGIISYSSFHNKFAMRNYLTLDFPLGNLIVRAAYLNNAYYTNLNYNNIHNVSHSFMLGLVKEFASFKGKYLKSGRLSQSAYY